MSRGKKRATSRQKSSPSVGKKARKSKKNYMLKRIESPDDIKKKSYILKRIEEPGLNKKLRMI